MPFDQPRITVQIRDDSLDIIGVVDDFTSLTLTPRFNAVGAYVLNIAADSPKAALLVPGNGLVIRKGPDVLMSGPIREPNWQSGDGGKGTLTVNGVDDMTLLTGTTCWPNPTAAAGSQTDPVYKIAGVVAETAMRALVNLNIGPGAQAARKVANLTLAADGGNGPSITRQVNQFDNLLTVLQDIAKTAGLGFRIVQVGGNLQFQVYEPADLSASAKFSFGLGNLTDASYSVTAPTCTKAVVVAGGNTSARTVSVTTRADPAFPGPWIEQFVDKTDVDSTATDLAAQIAQAAEEALTSGAAQGNLAMTPIDTPRLQFGRDYTVGDLVSCQVRDDFITDVVREVSISFDAQGGYVAKAVIGSSDSTDNQDVLARQFSYIAKIFTRLRRLETRKPS
ncbi:siphovirus ReqiPepy6 Gp37-like family protein [Streptomyces europaeiscabiei]|uniref:siphovirus ReqiPepy6 Gp37-like family protein n=1 Tax=Streptomyces europaeiscabiei TaxID=146819 RepID=UPI0029AE2EA1|nr:siphovirus ReqiPepy6 Gp37-like family protein [Streptomyces europaeiscabiei]MDX3712726.1 siphovirus ReqiPepy6 Gp37-like family protein [Streptomyces europaeiscabiei]